MANIQVVTVVFTDVVGSTELSSRIGRAASGKVRKDHFALLRQALAAADGTEVKNLGDGLMAVFSRNGRSGLTKLVSPIPASKKRLADRS